MSIPSCLVVGLLLATPDSTLVYSVPWDLSFAPIDPLRTMSELSGLPESSVVVNQFGSLLPYLAATPPCSYYASVY